MKATCCFEMLSVVCLHKYALLKDHLCPNAVEAVRGEPGWRADTEKVCISVLAVAQLPLTCLISQVFKSLGLPSQAHTLPQYPWLKCDWRSQCRAKLATQRLCWVMLITQTHCQCRHDWKQHIMQDIGSQEIWELLNSLRDSRNETTNCSPLTQPVILPL